MERLQQLYDELVDLIPEEQIDEYMACGCSVGRDYDLMTRRLLVVEKIPKADEFTVERSASCGCGCEDDCESGGKNDCGGCDNGSSCDCGGGHEHDHHDHHHDHHDHSHHDHSGFGGGALNSTDFTEAIGKISRHLLNIAPHQWPDSIAKTYLYKIAPIKGKAPSELLARQHDLCRDILLEEIRTYRPTHILFLTGWSGVWDFDFPIYPLLKGEMVEAVGRAENDALILVSRYAIRDSEDKFVADIVSAFRSLEENSAIE